MNNITTNITNPSLKINAWKHLLYYTKTDDKDIPIAEVKFSFLEKKVIVKNYSDNIFVKPFGTKETVTFKDLEDFIESRCFPRERFNCKDILKRLGLDCYDPFTIIEYNGGNCNEDDHYLKYLTPLINTDRKWYYDTSEK